MASGSSSYSSRDTNISAYMNQAASYPALTPEEEAFHANTYYDSRTELGHCLSAFPRIFLPGIQDARVTQIQMVAEAPDAEDQTVDEKRKVIIALVSSMETIADHLAEIADDESEEAVVSRKALHGSLKKLLTDFVFPFDFYADCMSDLNQCRDRLGGPDWSVARDLVLMPESEFTVALESCSDAFSRMEQARTALLESNLRIIIKLSRKYMKFGLSFQDLFQEGYFGMAIALDKFQPFRGHRFTTYAVWWIRQSITNALSSQARTIRLPANLGRLLTRIHRMEQVLLQQLGREPTDYEIAERLGQTPERIRAWRKIEQQPISLETTVGDEDKGSIHDMIADAGSKQPDEVVSSRMLKVAVSQVLATLDEREQNILKHRFGIEGKDLMTLEELSRRYDVSHERIRQIEAAALKKLRSPDRRKFFDGYY